MEDIGFTRIEALKALKENDHGKLVTNIKWVSSVGPTVLNDMSLGDAIIAHVDSSEPTVVIAAIEAMGGLETYGSQFVDYLMPKLSSDNPEVCLAAACALSNLGHGSGAPALAELASKDSESIEVRATSILQLGKTQAVEQADVISKLLENPSADLSGAACVALANLGAPGEQVADVIGAKLDGEGTRHHATLALSLMKSEVTKQFVGKLIQKCMTDPDQQTRLTASSIVGEAASEHDVGEIKNLLNHKDAGIRIAGALVCAKMGTKAASCTSELVPMLSDAGEDTSGMALQIGCGASRCPPAMRKLNCAALAALGSIGGDAHIEEISALLSSPDWEVRCGACECLGNIGSIPESLSAKIDEILTDNVYVVRAAACTLLGKLKAEDQLDQLVDMFQDKSQAVRVEAVAAIGAIGGDAAKSRLGEVFELLSDSSSVVRASAAKALGSFGESAQCFASCVATLLSDVDPLTRGAACEALSNFGEYGKALIEEIQEALEDESPVVQKAAQTALDTLKVAALPNTSGGTVADA